MSDSKVSFDLVPLHFVLLLGGLMGIIALVNGYCTIPGTCNSDPSKFGHSSDEIEYAFTVNELDCTSGANSGNGRCDVQCPDPFSEQIVSGSCVTNMGTNANTSGAIDDDDDGDVETWRCEYILPMGAGVCNNNFTCEKWRGETPTNCFSDCTSPADDTTLFARVTCLRKNP